MRSYLSHLVFFLQLCCRKLNSSRWVLPPMPLGVYVTHNTHQVTFLLKAGNLISQIHLACGFRQGLRARHWVYKDTEDSPEEVEILKKGRGHVDNKQLTVRACEAKNSQLDFRLTDFLVPMHVSMRHRKGHWTQPWSSAEGLVLRAWARGRSSISKWRSLTRNAVSQGVDTQQEDRSGRVQDTGESTTVQKDKALPPAMDQGKSESPKRAMIQNGGLSARTAGSESSRKTAGFPSGILVGEREGKNGLLPALLSREQLLHT